MREGEGVGGNESRASYGVSQMKKPYTFYVCMVTQTDTHARSALLKTCHACVNVVHVSREQTD